MRSIAALLFFVTAASVTPQQLQIDIAGLARSAQDPRFDAPKAQAAVELAVALDIGLAGFLSLRPALVGDFTFASSLSGGYYYRGHGALRMQMDLVLHPLLSLGSVDLGLAIGGGASLAGLWDTRLLTFYPSLHLGAQLGTLDLAGWRFRLILPVSLSFRADLVPTLAAGLGFRIAAIPEPTPTPETSATPVVEPDL